MWDLQLYEYCGNGSLVWCFYSLIKILILCCALKCFQISVVKLSFSKHQMKVWQPQLFIDIFFSDGFIREYGDSSELN